MKVLICDGDERYTSMGKKYILDYAAKIGMDVTVDVVESGERLLFFKETKYKDMDLIYMSYHLPGLSGISTAKQLRASGFIGDIVFYAFDDSHAREGYAVDALAYCIKGKESREEFEAIFLKAASRVKKNEEEMITLSHRGETRHIPLRHILYFEVRDHVVTVYYFRCGKIESFSFYSTLKQLTARLPSEDFWKCHKSFIVSKRHIYRSTTDEIEMINGSIIPMTQKA